MNCPTQVLLWLQQTREHTLLLLDEDGVVKEALGSVQLTFGYAPDELRGQHASLLFTPEDRALALDRHELKTARRIGHMENDRWLLRKDGVRIWVTGDCTGLVDAEGQPAGFLKVVRDQTRLRGEIEALRNRAVSRQEGEEISVAIFGALAHELRNPLAPLLTASELLRRTCRDEAARLPLQIMSRQLAVLNRLVDDLMDSTRLQTGKLELRHEPVVLQAALRRIVEPRRETAAKKSIDLVLSLPDVPIIVEVDPTRFEQIVVNLLTNALKYTPPGGRVVVKATTSDSDAQVKVKDTGIGIAPDMLPRIFDMFAQEAAAKDFAVGGLGIGLSLVKQLVEAHNGVVTVRSDGRNKGSQFTVRLPLRRNDATFSKRV